MTKFTKGDFGVLKEGVKSETGLPQVFHFKSDVVSSLYEMASYSEADIDPSLIATIFVMLEGYEKIHGSSGPLHIVIEDLNVEEHNIIDAREAARAHHDGFSMMLADLLLRLKNEDMRRDLLDRATADFMDIIEDFYKINYVR